MATHKIPKPKPSALEITTATGNKILIDDCFLQYLDIISKVFGITNYEEFSKMTEGDRLSYMREIKINKFLC